MLKLYWGFVLHLPDSLRQKTRLDFLRSFDPQHRDSRHSTLESSSRNTTSAPSTPAQGVQHSVLHHILRDINTLSYYTHLDDPRPSAPPSIRPRKQLPRSPTLDNRKDITTWSTFVQNILLALESGTRRMHDTRHDDDTRRSALGLRALALLHWPV